MDDHLKGVDDHIRSVHLTVMALTLLFLAASLVVPVHTYEKPIRDLTTIIHLSEDRGNIEQRMKNAITESVAKFTAKSVAQYQNSEPIVLAVEREAGPSFYAIETVVPWLYRPDERSSLALGYLDLSFRSVAAFKNFWDRNAEGKNILAIKRLESRHLVDSSTNEESTKPKLRILTPSEINDVRQRNILISSVNGRPMVRVGDGKLFMAYSDHDNHINTSFVLEPEVTEFPISLQRVLRSQIGQDHEWFLGTFEKSFPELQQASTGLTNLPLKDLLEFFNLKAREERERRSEHIDVFGAKIPGDKLNSYGVVLLVSVQTYLLLNIRRLRAIFRVSGDTPPAIVWIGGDLDPLNRLFVIVSGVIFPSAVVMALVTKLWPSSSLLLKGFSAIGILVSGAVALATIINLRGVLQHCREHKVRKTKA